MRRVSTNLDFSRPGSGSARKPERRAVSPGAARVPRVGKAWARSPFETGAAEPLHFIVRPRAGTLVERGASYTRLGPRRRGAARRAFGRARAGSDRGRARAAALPRGGEASGRMVPPALTGVAPGAGGRGRGARPWAVSAPSPKTPRRDAARWARGRGRLRRGGARAGDARRGRAGEGGGAAATAAAGVARRGATAARARPRALLAAGAGAGRRGESIARIALPIHGRGRTCFASDIASSRARNELCQCSPLTRIATDGRRAGVACASRRAGHACKVAASA